MGFYCVINTLTAVAEGTTSLTVTYGEVSTQVAVNVTNSTVVEPEDPTTDPTNPEKPATNPEEPTDEEEVTNPDVDFNVEVTNEDKIITVSTCADNNYYRVVLHAKLIEE